MFIEETLPADQFRKMGFRLAYSITVVAHSKFRMFLELCDSELEPLATTVLDWCRENLGEEWKYDELWSVIHFKTEGSAILFALRWEGTEWDD